MKWFNYYQKGLQNIHSSWCNLINLQPSNLNTSDDKKGLQLINNFFFNPGLSNRWLY